ncbi:MAG: spore cortex biosynthesis protein YabQ [Clostridia bacterium]|nr:spore cortex biosynthesis protein YabQ [Clostridia bacterium]NCC43747.1 spore cortex biosynthesis protein YabQ [Clostridia bacterium]
MSAYMGKELLLFTKSLWYGSFLMIIYDGLRILRRVLPHTSVIVAIEDLLFWMISSLFLFSRFFWENEGALRAYLFVGTVLGMLAWHYSLSRIYVDVCSGIMNKIKKILLIPARKVLILVKRLKLWARSVKISLYIRRMAVWNKWMAKRDRGAGHGKKEGCQKRKKYKSKTPEHPE